MPTLYHSGLVFCHSHFLFFLLAFLNMICLFWVKNKQFVFMKQTHLSKNIGITAIHLNAILAGRRNPSAKLAVRLEAETGIPRDVWMWGSKEERQAAWSGLRKAPGAEAG